MYSQTIQNNTRSNSEEATVKRVKKKNRMKYKHKEIKNRNEMKLYIYKGSGTLKQYKKYTFKKYKKNIKNSDKKDGM